MPEYIPAYDGLVDDPTNFNILLMGKNGSNVDTIIFANINSSNNKITLISIPRDLFYNGRKINSVYADYGIREQVKWIEEVVGYRIHHYALIDMYVFKDVIDLMGGVDVELEEDLIDPTYKVCDYNICSTLYYEAGMHHLDGTEALRIARSRYSTSDYSRAARQQLILEGIQNKAKSLGFGDANDLLNIINTVLSSIDTDIKVNDAVRYYFRYQNYELDRGHVLSSYNVLDAVPVPVDYVTSRVIKVCLDETDESTCSDSYAIDTLMPKDSNWDVIKWYVQELLY